MFLAIDRGLSNVDFFLKDNNEEKFWVEDNAKFVNEHDLLRYIDSLTSSLPISKVGLSGGKSKTILSDNSIWEYISEIDAFCIGAKKIYGFERGLVISCGTGTACAFADKGINSHLGGIANGGGFIHAFHKHFLNYSNIKKIHQLAANGNASNVDLLISEAVGNLGDLDPKLTAVNFGKLKDSNSYLDSDVSQAVMKMVGESIGTVAALYAHILGVTDVYLTGRTAQYPSVRNGIDSILATAKLSSVFIKESAKANVIGVMESLENYESNN